jgi:hypothetical protein
VSEMRRILGSLGREEGMVRIGWINGDRWGVGRSREEPRGAEKGEVMKVKWGWVSWRRGDLGEGLDMRSKACVE